MKRDVELIRKILMFVEGQDPNASEIHDIKLDGYTADEVFDHVQLADEAGWLRGAGYSMGPASHAIGLTMAGHDFLDAMRSETVWNRLKNTLSEKGGGLPLEVVSALAVSYARELVGLRSD